MLHSRERVPVVVMESHEEMALAVAGRIAAIISPATHFESIGRGVIDIRDVYYYSGITIFFLYLNTLVIDLRRWR